MTAMLDARFHPGAVCATPGALDALARSGQEPFFFLEKHLSGDWGDTLPDDARANDEALLSGGRVLSSYRTLRGERVWVLTEAAGDHGRRESTCLLLPDEY